MGIKNKIHEGKIYFLTFTVVDWVDIFTRPVYKHIIVESLEYCQIKKGMIIYAWCLMSNHIHLIAGAKEDNHLSNIIRDFKKFTSKKIIRTILDTPESRKKWMLNRFEFAGKYDSKIKNHKFWQDGNEAKEIETPEFLDQKLDYIHQNPVTAEIVENPEDYLYSSARNYAKMPGIIEVEKID